MSKIAILMEMESWPCLLVGGGQAAYERALVLLKAGAVVSCWSEAPIPELVDLAKGYGESLSIIRGKMSVEMLEHMLSSKQAPRLVVLAEEDFSENKCLFQVCEQLKTPASISGCSARLDFAHTIERGALYLAVSAESAPEPAAMLANKISREIPEDWREGSLAYAAWRNSAEVRKRHPEILASDCHELAAALVDSDGRFKSAKLRAERRLDKEI